MSALMHYVYVWRDHGRAAAASGIGKVGQQFVDDQVPYLLLFKIGTSNVRSHHQRILIDRPHS